MLSFYLPYANNRPLKHLQASGDEIHFGIGDLVVGLPLFFSHFDLW
jgi:hypothetical protein